MRLALLPQAASDVLDGCDSDATAALDAHHGCDSPHGGRALTNTPMGCAASSFGQV